MSVLVMSRRGGALFLLGLFGVVLAILFASGLETLWQQTLIWVLEIQRDLHLMLDQAMQGLAHGGQGALAWMVLLSFGYGVFHAAGPGHGKIVISTYLATHESRLTRGLILTGVASAVQAASAIALVGATAFLTDWTMRDAQGAALVLESCSYGLVALLGAVLCWRSGRRLLQRDRHEHRHDGAKDCGHAHGPDAAALAATAPFLMTVLSIGIRPCSGAVLVLLFAFSIDQVAAGVAAVLAMAAGTGMTVAALAALSVHARRMALKLAFLMDRSEERFGRLVDIAALAGGLVLTIIGGSLLMASRQLAQHPLL